MSQLQSDAFDGRVPFRGNEPIADQNTRLEQPVFRGDVIEVEPPVVAHPARVHVIVLARGLPVNHILARADDRVATGRAAGADTFRFLQEPDPHLETEIGRGQRTDGANVDRVQRVIVFERPIGMRGEDGVTAAIDKPEYVVVHNFLAKADTPRTQNAALVIERDARPELHGLRFLHFVFEEPRTSRAVLNAEFLQLAFARLIADRAVERMIDEQKFHDPALAFFHQRRVRAHAHAFTQILRARDLRTRHPVDDRFAVFAQLRLAVWPQPRHSDFDQTHPAIAG